MSDEFVNTPHAAPGTGSMTYLRNVRSSAHLQRATIRFSPPLPGTTRASKGARAGTRSALPCDSSYPWGQAVCRALVVYATRTPQ
jgi:hypothetical protein